MSLYLRFLIKDIYICSTSTYANNASIYISSVCTKSTCIWVINIKYYYVTDDYIRDVDTGNIYTEDTSTRSICVRGS